MLKLKNKTAAKDFAFAAVFLFPKIAKHLTLLFGTKWLFFYSLQSSTLRSSRMKHSTSGFECAQPVGNQSIVRLTSTSSGALRSFFLKFLWTSPLFISNSIFSSLDCATHSKLVKSTQKRIKKKMHKASSFKSGCQTTNITN